MFERLKLWEKLSLGFGGVLLLMLIMATVGLIQINAIKAIVVDIVKDRYPKIVLGNTSKELTLDNAILIRSAILSDDSNEIETLIRQAEGNRKTNNELLEKLDKVLVTETGKAAFAAIAESRKPLSAAYDKMYALLRENDDAKSVAYLKNDFSPLNNTYIAALQDLNKLITAYMDKGEEEALSVVSLIRSTMLVSLALGTR